MLSLILQLKQIICTQGPEGSPYAGGVFFLKVYLYICQSELSTFMSYNKYIVLWSYSLIDFSDFFHWGLSFQTTKSNKTKDSITFTWRVSYYLHEHTVTLIKRDCLISLRTYIWLNCVGRPDSPLSSEKVHVNADILFLITLYDTSPQHKLLGSPEFIKVPLLWRLCLPRRSITATSINKVLPPEDCVISLYEDCHSLELWPKRGRTDTQG